MRTILFSPRFAPLVEAGTKHQTVRAIPKNRRLLRVGESVSLRTWLGAPYRTKQRELRQGVVVGVRPVFFHAEGIDGVDNPLSFARADGFSDVQDLLAWFSQVHGLPFSGVMIEWAPAGTAHAASAEESSKALAPAFPCANCPRDGNCDC
jgi:hypothetical protein